MRATGFGLRGAKKITGIAIPNWVDYELVDEEAEACAMKAWVDANENDLLAAMGKYPDFPSLLRTRVIHQACKPIGSGSNWMTGLAEKGDNKAKFSVLRQQRITEIENAFQSERYDNIQCKYPYDDIRRILHTDSRIR